MKGIEDINEECSSLCSHPGTLHLTTMYKVTTPSIDSGNPDSSPPGLSSTSSVNLGIYFLQTATICS